MKKVFKGKIKHNFWIGIGYNLPLFMAICVAMMVIVVGTLLIFEPEYFDNEVPTSFAVSGCVAYLVLCYIFGRYYRYILRQWDKPGYEIMTADTETKTVSFDDKKVISFAEIESIRLEKCADSLPAIPKSYDMVNAKAVIKLLNGETIVFYMQKLEWIYNMIKYFKDLHIRVEADEFEHNKVYKIQSNTWKINLTLVLIAWIYMVYQMHKSGMF
ncbi:MAG: hypothetical protein J6N49_02255 [Alphaproteobacteria bacterium]|nr:hypothetical protein [Alphaproteobacteria bacterium]